MKLKSGNLAGSVLVEADCSRKTGETGSNLISVGRRRGEVELEEGGDEAGAPSSDSPSSVEANEVKSDSDISDAGVAVMSKPGSGLNGDVAEAE